MGFYDNEENVDNFIRMCEVYDGSNLHERLGKYLESSSTLLELGCGAGNDVAIL